MFQDHQLFPQRDVGGNVAFGLRMHGAARARTGRAGRRAAGPGRAAGRRSGGPSASLSGGEQQRVALARALAPRPRLLMLDEPLGQLDRALRERLVVELRELFGRLGTTVLAVTHDQGEAFALADRVVVMRDGRIAQSGTPLEVWQRPADEFVARFLGFDNVVEATVTGEAADTPWGKVPVPAGAAAGGVQRAGAAGRGAAGGRRRGPALHGRRPYLPGHPCRRAAAAGGRAAAGGGVRAAGRAGGRAVGGRRPSTPARTSSVLDADRRRTDAGVRRDAAGTRVDMRTGPPPVVRDGPTPGATSVTMLGGVRDQRVPGPTTAQAEEHGAAADGDQGDRDPGDQAGVGVRTGLGEVGVTGRGRRGVARDGAPGRWLPSEADGGRGRGLLGRRWSGGVRRGRGVGVGVGVSSVLQAVAGVVRFGLMSVALDVGHGLDVDAVLRVGRPVLREGDGGALPGALHRLLADLLRVGAVVLQVDGDRRPRRRTCPRR